MKSLGIGVWGEREREQERVREREREGLREGEESRNRSLGFRV